MESYCPSASVITLTITRKRARVGARLARHDCNVPQEESGNSAGGDH